MEIFEQHEQFEMQVLSELKSTRILEKLVFGGGTMLRLCHELNRYSVDLDFYLKKKENKDIISKLLSEKIAPLYQIRDFREKRNTLLMEIASPQFPRKLKIEINLTHQYSETEQSIAWSRFANQQVMVTTIRLPKMMELKTNALLNRKEIRDAFDIEFLIRLGVEINLPLENISKLKNVLSAFKLSDYRVKLGSIISAETRNYYNENGFNFFLNKLNFIENR
jgi:predicted nucleotidyltransferase component of viral defense system